ncbi:unnamed protein product [Caenorhabditis auriculariae]|uniref:Globin domain-containing protein n=1 Tax=Caenorhabditis auriculariae TaxID=2777116 RepID=A0A8S1HGI4_9PELO|nr:unnamed protein product [Caenorhabditis auriculariae]
MKLQVMGNEQSAADPFKARHSVDASFFRQVTHSTSSTPRVSVVQKSGETRQVTTSNINLHRLSTDCAELKYFRPKLSLGGEDMGNTQGRRLSRAAITIENGSSVDNSTFVEALKLTPYQTQQLMSTWPKIKANGTIFAQVFKVLMTKSPTTREMFQKMSIVEGFRSKQCCELNMHAKVLAELLDSLLNDLQQPSKLVQARCMDIGASHVSMSDKCHGVLFDQLGETLTEVFTKTECVRTKREAAKAWISVLSYLVDGMRGGYMEEWSKRRRLVGSL